MNMMHVKSNKTTIKFELNILRSTTKSFTHIFQKQVKIIQSKSKQKFRHFTVYNDAFTKYYPKWVRPLKVEQNYFFFSS